MSLAYLNTTPIHEAGIVHHLTFTHLKRDERGVLVMEDTGLPKVDRIAALYNEWGGSRQPVELILRGPDSHAASRGSFVSFDIERTAAFEQRPVTVEESARANRSRWASAVMGWNNVPQAWVNGYDPRDPASMADADKPIPFSEENLDKLLQNVGMTWIGEQIDQVMGSRERFLPSALTPFAPTQNTSSKSQRLASRRRSPKS